MTRAVVDTNVLVSSLIAPTGNEALILLAIRQGLVKPSFSEEILREYTEVLARPKFGVALDEINALIALLRSQGEEIEKPESLASSLPDPGDDKLLAWAKAASADFHRNRQQAAFPGTGVRSHPRC